MRYCSINPTDIANGEGVRTSIFVSGCRHRCKGCFNEETWDFGSGEEFTDDTLAALMDMLDKPFIAGLSILGGDPLEPENQPDVLKLIKRAKSYHPSKSIWLYTGFTWEQIHGGSRATTVLAPEILEHTDILVDGRFDMSKKNLGLWFRGSSNQRVIDVPLSLATGAVSTYRNVSDERVLHL